MVSSSGTHEVVLRVAVHPAVLHLDDVGRRARLQRGQHALRQAVRRRHLHLDGDAGIGRHELVGQLLGARLAPVGRPPHDFAGRDEGGAARQCRHGQRKQACELQSVHSFSSRFAANGRGFSSGDAGALYCKAIVSLTRFAGAAAPPTMTAPGRRVLRPARACSRPCRHGRRARARDSRVPARGREP